MSLDKLPPELLILIHDFVVRSAGSVDWVPSKFPETNKRTYTLCRNRGWNARLLHACRQRGPKNVAWCLNHITQAPPDRPFKTFLNHIPPAAVDQALLGVAVGVRDRDRFGPEYYAARNGISGVIKLCLDHRLKYMDQAAEDVAVRDASEDHAEIDERPSVTSPFSKDNILEDCRVALTEAVFRQEVDCVELLLTSITKLKPDSILRSKTDDRDLLATAIKNGNPNMVESLVKAGIDVDLEGLICGTPLWEASCLPLGDLCRGPASNVRCAAELVRVLVENGADVHRRTVEGRTPIFIKTNCKATMEVLKDKGASLDDRDREGRTPLFYAIQRGCLFSLRQLLELGADVNLQVNGMGYMDHALSDLRMMRALHERGAPICPERTLLKAMEKKYTGPMRFLKGKVDEPDGNFMCRAAQSSEAARVLTRLRKQGYSANSPCGHGYPLICVAKIGDLKLVNLLLSMKANINATDREGRTALSLAAEHDRLDVVELLLTKGADTEARDKFGFRPLHYSETTKVGSAIRRKMTARRRQTKLRKGLRSRRGVSYVY